MRNRKKEKKPRSWGRIGREGEKVMKRFELGMEKRKEREERCWRSAAQGGGASGGEGKEAEMKVDNFTTGQ
jgi:hypothetical protein